MEEYPAWQGQSIPGECLFDPQNPSQGPWWVCWWRWRCSLPPWLSLSPSLTEISPIDPVFGDGQHSWWCWTRFGGAWSRPGPRRSPPSTWPTSPCPPTRSSPCPTIWSGSRLREGVLNKLTALLSFSRIWSGYQVFSGFSSKINWSSLRPSAHLWVVAVAYLELFQNQDTVTLIGIEGTVILILMGALPAPSPVYCVGRDHGNYT